MLYIKCNHCGNLNQFQNEYLIFCSHCNKKLDNNYSSWLKANPDKEKAEFVKKYCISDEDLAEMNKNRPRKKSKLAYIIGLVIVASISSALAGIGVNELLKYYEKNNTSSEISEDAWKTTSYGSLGLQIESPFILTPVEVKLPEEIKSFILVSENYAYESLSGINIIVMNFMYSKEVNEINLEGAINGGINELKTQPGVSNVDYQVEDVELNGNPGYRLTGSLLKDELAMNFIISGYSKESNFYQVLVVYMQDDSIGEKAAERIIASISFP
jgi:hypothetical protein